ncbi:hypothetical protein C8R44DRAFT_873245 [Mycena epipterygia]|nr:hypothetical protein C8R44DRAFT_873245 [Mycena epipterygia]
MISSLRRFLLCPSEFPRFLLAFRAFFLTSYCNTSAAANSFPLLGAACRMRTFRGAGVDISGPRMTFEAGNRRQ